MENLKYKHCVINTNPWFSAVTEYSLQFVSFLSLKDDCVMIGFEKALLWKHLSLEKVKKIKVKENFKFLNLWMTLFILVLFSHRQCVFWCFEGREQTFLGILKIFWGPFWGPRKIVRVRGQAQKIRSSLTHRFLYGKLTHYTAFASLTLYPQNILKLKEDKYGIHFFSADKKCQDVFLEDRFDFLDSYFIDSRLPLLSMVARYDPVKGHRELLDCFLNYLFLEPVQLVFLGQSQNIKMKELEIFILERGGKLLVKSEQRVLFEKGNLRLFLFDERLPSLDWFFQKTWMGVISSLGSEVICRVALEFMQNGVKVLSTNVGALEEVVGGFEENMAFKIEYFDKFPLLAEYLWNQKYSRELLSLKSMEKFGLHRFEELYQKGIS